MNKQKVNTFSKITIISGSLLMGISYTIFKTLNHGFWGEVHSEIFGIGIGIVVIGLIALLFRIKL